MIRALDPPVDLLHERVDVGEQGLVPQPLVGELRPERVELGLQRVLATGADELLELAVGGEDDLGGRHLVDVAHLQAHDAVLDVVHDADAVARGHLGHAADQLHQAQLLVVEARGQPVAEADGDLLGPVRRPLRGRHELEDVLGRRLVEVLDDAALARASPEVVVDRVGALDGGGDRDAVLLRVGDLLVAAHLPLAHRGDHLQVGRQRRDRRLDAHLVVPLAGAAVGDRVGPVLAGRVAGQLRQQGAAEGGEERIAPLVAAVRPDRRGHVVAGELLLGVHDEALHRPQVERLPAHGVEVVVRLPEVDAQGHDLGVVLVLDPLEHHRRVQAARVQEHHAVHLVGLREVARDGRGGAVLGQRRSSGRMAAGESSAVVRGAVGPTRARGRQPANSTFGGDASFQTSRIPVISDGRHLDIDTPDPRSFGRMSPAGVHSALAGPRRPPGRRVRALRVRLRARPGGVAGRGHRARAAGLDRGPGQRDRARLPRGGPRRGAAVGHGGAHRPERGRRGPPGRAGARLPGHAAPRVQPPRAGAHHHPGPRRRLRALPRGGRHAAGGGLPALGGRGGRGAGERGPAGGVRTTSGATRSGSRPGCPAAPPGAPGGSRPARRRPRRPPGRRPSTPRGSPRP